MPILSQHTQDVFHTLQEVIAFHAYHWLELGGIPDIPKQKMGGGGVTNCNSKMRGGISPAIMMMPYYPRGLLNARNNLC